MTIALCIIAYWAAAFALCCWMKCRVCGGVTNGTLIQFIFIGGVLAPSIPFCLLDRAGWFDKVALSCKRKEGGE